MSRRF